MRGFVFSIGVVLAAVLQSATPGRTTSIYDMPRIWPRHAQLRQELIAAIRRGDIRAMESTCRAALELMPDDPTWHYNLACALAYREQPGQALEELDKAIEFGFRDADAIAKDSDLSRISKLPRFVELVAKARDMANKPVAGKPAVKHAEMPAGGVLTLTATNLAWNFDVGLFEALVKLDAPVRALPDLAAKYSATKPTSPERPYVAAWLSEGTGSGNTGDLYVNRDGGHSQVATGDFPNLTSIRYEEAGMSSGIHLNHPNTLFGNSPVFGNISRGRTSGAFWRSLARASFTDPGLAARMDLLYRNNQFWVIPAVKDAGQPELGDVFPAAAPFQLVTLGASWSDQPFIRAALAASASFIRPTKQALVRRRLMAPTLQGLFRRTQKNVRSESDYLSPAAHPTVFDAKQMDAAALVKRAHLLKPDEIPPAVSLSLINSRIFPIRYPEPVRDYPDTVTEVLFATPSAISFILRAPDGERTFLLRARTAPEEDLSAEFAWRVVRGPAEAVKISTPLGETFNNPEHGFAQITVDRRNLTNRIDIACFAKTHNTGYGAPAIFSLYPIPQEKRTYRPDGKIGAIDYTNPGRIYSDPVIALPRHWIDTYKYAPDGSPLGFTRSYNGKPAADFTRSGERIVARKTDGTPKTLVRVKYVPRGTGNAIEPVELTYMDDGEPFEAP